MSLHGGWEKARRQAEIDRLLDAGPLSTVVRIGTNHGQISRRSAAGRLRLGPRHGGGNLPRPPAGVSARTNLCSIMNSRILSFDWTGRPDRAAALE